MDPATMIVTSVGFFVFALFFCGLGIYLARLANTRASKAEQLVESLKTAVRTSESKRKSTEVRTGQLVEKWIPFSKQFEFDPHKAKFLGEPIDFIVFGDDEIVFIEVKTGQAKLSKNQRLVRSLVEQGKVRFMEVRAT